MLRIDKSMQKLSLDQSSGIGDVITAKLQDLVLLIEMLSSEILVSKRSLSREDWMGVWDL